MAHPVKPAVLRISPPRLGTQMMAILGVFAAVVLVGFTASAVYFVNRAEISAWQGRQGEAARNAAGVMAAVIDRARVTLEFVALLHESRLDYAVESQTELSDLLERNPSLEEVIQLDAGGKVVFETHRSASVLAQLITIPQSRWFVVARGGQAYLGPVELTYDLQPYLLLAIPAPEGGVVAARVQFGALWAALGDVRFGEAGRAYVVTRAGEVVAHTNSDVVLAGVSLAGRPELQALLVAPNSEWHGEYTNFQGERVVGATAPVPNTDWVVITELPRGEAFAASRTALAVLGGGLLLVTITLMWVAKRAVRRLVIQPMDQLRAGAARLGQGDLDYRLGLTRADEIGQLARAFDQMAEHLGERDRQVAAQTAALRVSEARYRAIVEDQTELICRYQPDGTLTFVNEAYCRYFGLSRIYIGLNVYSKYNFCTYKSLHYRSLLGKLTKIVLRSRAFCESAQKCFQRFFILTRKNL